MAFKVGDRVVRNPDSWNWGEQDCDKNNSPTTGTIVSIRNKWLDVKWDGGRTNCYPTEDLLLAGQSKQTVVLTPTPLKHSDPIKQALLNFFKSKPLSKCLICNAPGYEMFLKFSCSNPACQNYRR